MKKGQGGVSWQVVAMVLAISVIAVLGYWFFFIYRKGGGEVDLAFCKAKFLEYCAKYSQDLENLPGFTSSYAKNCEPFKNEITDSKEGCQRVLGQPVG